MRTERVRVSRQAEHYLLKSQAARPGDVLYREESDNTGRRALSLSPVGASPFNRFVGQPSSAKASFSLSWKCSAQSCPKPWNGSLNRAVMNVTLGMLPAVIADAESFFARSSGGQYYLFTYDKQAYDRLYILSSRVFPFFTR